MGLQRKQGEVIQEGQQFDIRRTVDEFRHAVNMYVFWTPGMEIYVSHVRRKQIPLYVFPNGYKRVRSPGILNQQPCEQVSRKRKSEGELVECDSSQKRQSVSPESRDSVSPVIVNHSCDSPSSEDEELAGGNSQVLVSNYFLLKDFTFMKKLYFST